VACEAIAGCNLRVMEISAGNDALAALLVPAVIAAVGYVAKLSIEVWQKWRATKRVNWASLHRLRALLQASHAAFVTQREQAGKLAEKVRQTKPQLASAEGLEHLFSSAHAQFTPDEADLHTIVRGYTEHALLPINEALLEWLRLDEHRISVGKTGKELTLAVLLNSLDVHLQLWRAKYRAWIPDRREHALVYMDDEQRHGAVFPHGIEDALDAVLGTAPRPTLPMNVAVDALPPSPPA
jgi:hypothetical protein